MARTRLISLDDVDRLTELVVENREFMAPYEPPRAETYHSRPGQEAAVRDALRRHAAGGCLPRVILDDDGEVAGRITLNPIVRGPLMMANIGYWVRQHAGGRGLATAALGEIVRLCFDELGLHRLEAGTLVDNVRSQRVLGNHGFERFGLAPGMLHIGGKWQDHVLFQLLNPEPCEPEWPRST
ncbi:MAG: GNAT family N-acetyltransferase [Marmoricola sp.]